MRKSQAALAIIEQQDAWLVQWNSNWQAYSLIGGHVEAGESFRECCIREITEELECAPADVEVAFESYADLHFCECSKAARVETEYQWELFRASICDHLRSNLPNDCKWVTPAQIKNGLANDGKPIAAQVGRVLDAHQEWQMSRLTGC
jgi:8-oxo-dGTP pyrophosphatase MutT (NUDIX family)